MQLKKIFREECRNGLRDTARRIRIEEPDDMFTALRQVFYQYGWVPLVSAMQYLWLKLLLMGPLLLWLFQAGWGVQAQDQAIEIAQIRWAGQIAVSAAVLVDMISRTVAAWMDPEDGADLTKWRKSFGKLAAFNLLTWMLGMLANYGQFVELGYADRVSLTILVAWVGAIVLSEFYSAARNFGLMRVVSRMIHLYLMGSGQKEVSEENLEEMAGGSN